MQKKLVILIISSILLFTSCESAPGNIIHESGYFQYRIIDIDNDNLEEALIMGLSAEGKKQETLVIPTTIDKYEVVSLGDNNGFQGKEGNIYIDTLKNVYITDHIDYIGNEQFFNFNNSEYDNYQNSVFIGNVNVNEYDYLWYNIFRNFDNIYLAKETSEIEFYSEKLIKNKCIYANVIYDLNYGESNIFMVDDCDGTIVSILPPNPIREGYEFLGWYKEPECINKWDFENDIVPAKEYDETGEYIFKETKLYAKWEVK